MVTAPAKKWISNSSVMDFFLVPEEIKAWTEWACHHIMLASRPPASQSSVCRSPWWPPAAKRGFVHSVCKGKEGEKWFWARKESGAELSRLSKEAMLTLKLSHSHLIMSVGSDWDGFRRAACLSWLGDMNMSTKCGNNGNLNKMFLSSCEGGNTTSRLTQKKGSQCHFLH